MNLIRGMIASDRRMREEHVAYILREVIKVSFSVAEYYLYRPQKILKRYQQATISIICCRKKSKATSNIQYIFYVLVIYV